MRVRMLFPALLLGVALPAASQIQANVRIDSVRHSVVLRTGPWAVPRTNGGYNGMVHDMSAEPAQQTFTWPVTGWLRGVKLRVLDAKGAELSRGLIHHLNVVNFGRRQLFYAIPERIIAIGRETEDMRLPATVGVPVTAGMPMAINFAWFNEAEPLAGVAIELTVEWSPENTVPRPLSVLPVHLGVVSPVASDPSFNLPPGRTSWSAEYTMPIDGRIIGAGGHQHDFGTGITLEDITGGKPRGVLRIASTLDTAGRIVAMQRVLPGVSGDGIKLSAAHRMRVTGTYDNRSGAPLMKGAMVHLAVLFAPVNMKAWPAIDTSDPDWERDVSELMTPQRGAMAGMHMGGH